MAECRYNDADDCVVVYRCEPVYPEGGAPNEWSDLGREDPMCGAPSVIGTKQNGDCGTADDFASQCEAEGGKLGNSCVYSLCAGPGVGATCFAPPLVPTPIEFSCGGLFNCSAGEVCHRQNPTMDGCIEHACEEPPAACANDLSCDCLEANLPADGPGSSLGCTEDGNGNPTLITSK